MDPDGAKQEFSTHPDVGVEENWPDEHTVQLVPPISTAPEPTPASTTEPTGHSLQVAEPFAPEKNRAGQPTQAVDVLAPASGLNFPARQH